ncbi:FlgD immunoglobulin-like domain containing protein, partial [Candidatus Neomarinimicrobiota bacterium]
TGKRVRSFDEGDRQPGIYEIQWNGRDDAGHEVSSGIYLVLLVTPEHTKSIKLILLK